MVAPVKNPGNRVRRLLRGAWRLLWRTGMGVLVLLALVSASLFLPEVRQGVLGAGVRVADRFLPGTFATGSVRWPHLNHLEFDSLLWLTDDTVPRVAPGDTIARVTGLQVEVDLQSLRHGEIFVPLLRADVHLLDIPLLQRMFPPGEPSGAAPDTAAAGESFLREGALPPIPSVAVANLDLSVGRVVVATNLEVRAGRLMGLLEARAGFKPVLDLNHSALTVLQTDTLRMRHTLDHLGLKLTANPDGSGVTLDSLNVIIGTAGPEDMQADWIAAGPVQLELTGQARWSPQSAAGEIQGACRLPGPAHFKSRLPVDFPLADAGHLLGRLRLSAEVADLSRPNPTARVDLDFSETAWLDEFKLQAGLSDFQVTVDTLSLAAFGAWVQVAGQVDSTHVDLAFGLGLEDSTALVMAGLAEPDEATARLVLTGMAQGPLTRPTFRLDLESTLAIPDVVVPELRVSLAGKWPHVSGEVMARGPLDLAGTPLDSLRLRLREAVARPDSLFADFELEMSAPDGQVFLVSTVRRDSVFEIGLDTLAVTARGETLATTGPAVLRYGPGEIHVDSFEMKGAPGTLALSGDWVPQGLDLASVIDLYLDEALLQKLAPNPLWSQDGGLDLALESRVDLAGSGERPDFTGQARVSILPHRDRPSLYVDLDYHLLSGSTGEGHGLGVDLTVAADDTLLLTGSLRWPGQANLGAGTWQPDPEQGLILDIPRQSLDLKLFDHLLPPELGLEGRLGFQFALQTTPPDLLQDSPDSTNRFFGTLTGSLRADGVEIDLPNQSRLIVNMDCEVAGTTGDPRLQGQVEVASGFIKIPQLPQKLLPTKGESLLWTVQADPADTTAEFHFVPAPKAGQGPVMKPARPLPLPDMDLKIIIPGKLHVNGYGLNIELEGEVDVTRGVDARGFPGPSLQGSVSVREGNLNFMKRVFKIQTAAVSFTGQVPANPRLDLLMETTVSGYEIIIEVKGRADKPEVHLRSTPELNEVDIMAVLLFGQPANSLDSDQAGRMNQEEDPGQQLRENLTAVALMFGTSDLTNSMSNNLGVDMVELGSDSEGEATLVVGKFITPRILVKYNQSLEKSGTYFVTMDYGLNRFFKLVSTYGQGEEDSGLELNWTKRY